MTKNNKKHKMLHDMQHLKYIWT